MSANHQQFHLLVAGNERSLAESWPGPGAAASPAGVRADALVVPPDPAWLIAPPKTPARLSTLKAESGRACAILEPVTRGRLSVLFCQRVGPHPVRVNGLPIPLFATLKESDHLQIGTAFACYITLFNRPGLEDASPAWVGRECPVCRVPVALGVRCYVCPCGAILHCEVAATEDSLQCAQLRARSGCPACQRPVVLEAGYTFLPEVDHA
jgi:hypothetical protein